MSEVMIRINFIIYNIRPVNPYLIQFQYFHKQSSFKLNALNARIASCPVIYRRCLRKTLTVKALSKFAADDTLKLILLSSKVNKTWNFMWMIHMKFQVLFSTKKKRAIRVIISCRWQTIHMICHALFLGKHRWYKGHYFKAKVQNSLHIRTVWSQPLFLKMLLSSQWFSNEQ